MPRPSSEIHFFHIPKTAGSSLGGMIRRAYPEEEQIPIYDAFHLVKMPPEQVPRYRCYSGHFFSLLAPLVGRPLPTVTLLREPRAQSWSLIQHTERMDPRAIKLFPLAARVLHYAWDWIPPVRPLIEPHATRLLLNNFQTRLLGCEIERPAAAKLPALSPIYPFDHPSLQPPPADMERVFERAKARLKSMAVVGTVERFPESAQLIFDLIGAPLPATLPRDNVTSRRPRFRPGLSKAMTRLIDRETEYDRALYEFANSLLDERLERHRGGRSPTSADFS